MLKANLVTDRENLGAVKSLKSKVLAILSFEWAGKVLRFEEGVKRVG